VSAQWRVIEPSSGSTTLIPFGPKLLVVVCCCDTCGAARSSGERRGCGEDGGEEHVGPNESVPLVQLVFFWKQLLVQLVPPLSRVCSRIRILQKEKYFFRKQLSFCLCKEAAINLLPNSSFFEGFAPKLIYTLPWKKVIGKQITARGSVRDE